MELMNYTISLVTAAALFLLSGCSNPELQDISPDTANGVSLGSPSTAGLTVSLAGDSQRLYAVSLNAGVWRSDGPTHPWEQLHASPARAYSIASDPADNQHLIVGEREDDKASSSARHSGLWESRDGGSTWVYVLDPVTLGCATQAIPSVAFSKTGIAFAATACGVALRAPGAANFQLASNTSQAGPITAIAISPNATWARSADRLLIGDSIGQLWEVKALPAYAVAGQGSAGDLYSLAATDSFAYFTCCSASVPPNCADPANPGTYGSLNTLLIYNLEFDTWKLQPGLDTAQGTPGLGCDGTGLGGSKFVHIFTSSQLLPGVPPLKLFVYSTAQDIYEATGFNSDGSAKGWHKILSAANGDNVHSDYWDFLLDFKTGQMWVSNDGGVYERNSSGGPWLTRVQGLHTHHIHTLTLMGEGLPGPKLAYPTSDNEAWFTTLLSSPSAWHHSGSLGDVNWSAGDVANPHSALVVRQPGNGLGALVQDSSPYVVPITARQNGGFDGPGSFHFVQTLSSEGEPDSTLDAVMLTTLPLQYFDPVDKTLKGVAGDLGDATKGARVVLLRNRHFELSPDINTSKGAGWNSETDTPAGTTRFWVTGGHANPVYFAMATQGGSVKLFRKGGAATGANQWLELNVQGKLSDPKPYPNSGILADPSLWKGPVFVNPYKADEIFVLTSNGIQVSNTQGESFAVDANLTALVTGSGTYAVGSVFSGGNSAGVRQANRSALNGMGALSDMAFLREDPTIAVASSPFTGLFYRKNNKWLNLSSYLLTPRAPISSVAVDPSTLYFATEGRGVFRLIGYSNGGT
jgi:hypothetical protein